MNAKMSNIENYQKFVNLIFQERDYSEILSKSLGMDSGKIISEIENSGLRGRGGAGFPTGIKWRTVASKKDKKYIICNADEGEPGTFKDREILQKRAEMVLTGMAICAHAIDCNEGYIYLRGEYNYLIPNLQLTIDNFTRKAKDSGLDFTIKIVSGSGAYICGEETSLLESMEGKRGEARNKPPYPADFGYLGKPTVINNVETFVYAAIILEKGSDAFRNLGTGDSHGAKLFCVSGDTPVPGIYELELGMKLSEFVDLFGDGDAKAVQIGGSSGTCVSRKDFDRTIIGFEGIPTGGSMMIFNSSRSMYHILSNYLDFFAEESCGQCTPCRTGCQQLLKGIEKVKKGEMPSTYIDELIKLSNTMEIASKCGLGQSVSHPFKSIVSNFREEIVF